MDKIFDIGAGGDSASKKRKSSGNDENEVSIFVFFVSFNLIKKCRVFDLAFISLNYQTFKIYAFFTSENLKGQRMIFLSQTFLEMISLNN